jgi:hypothetical protein
MDEPQSPANCTELSGARGRFGVGDGVHENEEDEEEPGEDGRNEDEETIEGEEDEKE